MRVAIAFLRRDLLIWQTYRLAALWQILAVLTMGGLLYFVDTSLLGGANSALQGGSYAAFALSGLAFSDAIMQSLYAIPGSIRDNQRSGTLETMLMTPIADIHLALSSALFMVVLGLGRLVVYLGFGVIMLGFWRQANLLTVALVLAPAILAFLALGTLSAAFIVVFKQGDPVVIAYSALTGLLSGLLFPVAVLPAWAQSLAAFLPLTHALNGIRAGLDGAPPSAVFDSVVILLLMTAVLAPIGLGAFAWAVNLARREGSLVQY